MGSSKINIHTVFPRKALFIDRNTVSTFQLAFIMVYFEALYAEKCFGVYCHSATLYSLLSLP